jgi:hypothetical protein
MRVNRSLGDCAQIRWVLVPPADRPSLDPTVYRTGPIILRSPPGAPSAIP